MMNKTYTAFRNCKGTFSRTWALKPREVHGIYTMVIRPILTYNSIVWWPRVTYNVRKDRKISLSGYNRGDQDEPNSCNGGPPHTYSSSYYD
jgi:hypothetical protein